MKPGRSIEVISDSECVKLCGKIFQNEETFKQARNAFPKNDFDLSVIVPLFNAEKYIAMTLNSILSSATKIRMEVIVVDDGSTDQGVILARDLLNSQQCAGVLVLKQKNYGSASARNLGIRCATGSYIAFLDSDDLFVSGGYAVLIHLAKKWDCEQVICRSMILNEPDQSLIRFYDYEIWETLFKGRKFAELNPLAEPLLFALEVSTVPRIWNRKFYIDNKLFFPEGKTIEDAAVHILSLAASKRIGILNQPLFFYRVGRPGQNTSITDQRRFDVFLIVHEMLDRLAEIEIPEAVGAQIVFSIHRMVDWCGNMIDFEHRREFYRKAKMLYRRLPKKWVDRYYIDFNNDTRSWHFKNIVTLGDGLPMPIRIWLQRHISVV